MKKRGRVKFHKVKTWQLCVVLLLLFFVDATLMRIDHIRMTELRDAVMAADEAEATDEEIAVKLAELKEFVFNNIVVNVVDDNGVQRVTFGTGPFYLEHQYNRDAKAALEEAEQNLAADSNPNGNIYAAASEACRAPALANGWSWDNENYINCMLGEIQKYPAAEELQDRIVAKLPSTGLYRHNYASPVWAPTLTGFFVLITLVIIVVIFIRGFVWIVLRLSLLFA